MVPETKRRTWILYNRLCHYYDWLAASETRFNEQMITRLNIQPGEYVLEIGSGTGKSMVSLADRVRASGKIVGIDLSTGMLFKARSRLDNHWLAGQTALTMGDGAHLPYASGCFDVVFMAFTLEIFSPMEIGNVLKECNRVLSTGGRLGLVCLVSMPKPNRMLRLYEWSHRRWPEWIDCRPISPGNYLQEAGFNMIDQKSETLWGLPVGMYLCKS
jgi:ubiquinone/menaquinone biosynthesis C-methylase UbiE